MSAHRQEELASLLSEHFPPIDHPLAYGSGIFHQPGLYATPPSPSRRSENTGAHDGPMLDFIFPVRDPVAWHRENMTRNRTHYRGVARWFPARTIAACAEKIGAGVHFNSIVPVHHKQQRHVIKYGVIATSRLLRDLCNWSDLYLAGRLHKPVLDLRTNTTNNTTNNTTSTFTLDEGIRANHRSALFTALLLLPERFTQRELLAAITGISYTGDVRLAVAAEDPKKVDRLVEGSRGELDTMYAPHIHEAIHTLGVLDREEEEPEEEGIYRQRTPHCREARLELLTRLPPGLIRATAAALGAEEKEVHELDTARRIAAYGARECAAAVQAVVRGLVRRSSVKQAVAGLVTNGPAVALKYLANKWRKGGIGRGNQLQL